MDLGDSCSLDYLQDATRFLFNLTSDGKGGLLHEGISSEQMRKGEILLTRRATRRRRMSERGVSRNENQFRLVDHFAELIAPSSDEVYLDLAASLISQEKPRGSALVAAWKAIRKTFVPYEAWLTKEVEWHCEPRYLEPEIPLTKKEIEQAEARELKEKAVAAFELCMANAVNWKSAVMVVADDLDIDFSRQAIKFNKSRLTEEKSRPDQAVKPDPIPVDLWGKFDPPDLPRGLLPPLIEEFAFTMGEQMGADPAGIAMSCLCVCGAAISDAIKVKVKRHADWYEAARIWVCIVGAPSTKKTQILSAATRPLCAIDSRLLGEWKEKMNRFNALPPEDRKGKKPPLQKRKRIEDITTEAPQMVLEGSTDGILCVQDELSGWVNGQIQRRQGCFGRPRLLAKVI